MIINNNNIQPNIVVNQNRVRQNKQKPVETSKTQASFEGIGSGANSALRFLDTNKAFGAIFVDIAFMVLPRIAVDFTRGPAAGIETARREASGTTNHSLIGSYGLLGGTLAAIGLNKKYGLKAQKIFTGNENLDILGESMDKHIKANSSADVALQKYLKEVSSKIEGFNPDVDGNNSWRGVSEKTSDLVAEKIKGELPNKSLSKDAKAFLSGIITKDIGAETDVKLKGAKNSYSVGIILDNIHKVSKSFTSENVQKAFKDSAGIAGNEFLKNIKSLNGKTAVVGLGLASLAGALTQPINMYLTRKKTGNDGFVGVEGREPDKSNAFKMQKTAAAGAFGAMILGLIAGANPKKWGPKNVLSKVQFNGMVPTMNQFKLVYGATIMSRFMSARDKNELRESAIKDTLGLLNWLILGNFVSKAAAKGFERFIDGPDKQLINIDKKFKGKGPLKWIMNASIKSRDEILQTALKDVKEVKEAVKEGKALPFKELMKLADTHAKPALKKVKLLNAAQLLGYLYSGVVLGAGIPKLNIMITNRVEGKNKPKADDVKTAESKLPADAKAEKKDAEDAKAA